MQRPFFLNQIEKQMKVHPVCGLLGPRQTGKTTLARQYAANYTDGPVHFFDLENPFDLARLQEPYSSLSPLEGLVVIDEIQLVPNLFPILRVLVDERPRMFLILGSASRDLIHQSSETLAGRIGYIELTPFSLDEVQDLRTLWRRGGFPRSYLAEDDEDSVLWRQAYITTFLERDIPNLGFKIPPVQMRRFWMMLCHSHGQIFNASDIGRSLGVTDHTVRKYLDLLVGTFMARSLAPWLENISKRQVKSPKIYFRDSGILHTLLGLKSQGDIEGHPKLSASWEGFALEETIRINRMRSEDCYFWATQSGAELDLLLLKNGKRLGFEFKYADAPRITSSMRRVMEDLNLDHLSVIYPGDKHYDLNEKISVVGIESPAFLENDKV
jgi:predicted AAA+ superfamily ATPase